jgi:hypothetical protein
MNTPETSAETEARALIARLHDAGIWLRFEGDQIKWTTHTAHGLTISDIRMIKRLTPELKPLLAFSEAADAAVDAYDGGAA